MSEPSVRWSQSQKEAFSYIRSGVERQLSATNALKQYRSGGGRISNEYWYSLYKTEFNYSGVKEKIKEVPITYNITPAMFEPTDFDYHSKYVVQMKVSGYSEELGMRITKWVTVESDEILTKSEWRYGAQQAINDTIGSIPLSIDSFLEYDARIRMS